MIRLFRKKTAETEFQEQVLEGIRARYTGSFDTKLRCYCKDAIFDIAIESDRTARFAHRRLFGPYLSPALQIDRFEVEHAYECGLCRFRYDPEYIEKERGYVPKEKISPIPRLSEVNESAAFVRVA